MRLKSWKLGLGTPCKLAILEAIFGVKSIIIVIYGMRSFKGFYVKFNEDLSRYAITFSLFKGRATTLITMKSPGVIIVNNQINPFIGVIILKLV